MKTFCSSILHAGLGALLASLALSSSAAALLPLAKPAAAPVTGVIDPVSGFLSLNGTLRRTWTQVGNVYVATNPDSTAYSKTITVGGVSRRYLTVRPNTLVANAPVLFLLHANSVTPETMAILTEVADFASTQGFWAILPAATGGVWKDDPTTGSNEDVRFISALIDKLVGEGADASRIYSSGYSSGGFMSARLACELSDKIAAFGIDAATMRTGLSMSCTPVKSRAKVFFLGTADSIVPYAGIGNLLSATGVMSFWSGKQACGGTLANPIPDRVADGTSVQQTRYTGCSGGTENQLYTITGGGHSWPGGLTTNVDVTTQDIKATGLIWRFVSAYRR